MLAEPPIDARFPASWTSSATGPPDSAVRGSAEDGALAQADPAISTTPATKAAALTFPGSPATIRNLPMAVLLSTKPLRSPKSSVHLGKVHLPRTPSTPNSRELERFVQPNPRTGRRRRPRFPFELPPPAAAHTHFSARGHQNQESHRETAATRIVGVASSVSCIRARFFFNFFRALVQVAVSSRVRGMAVFLFCFQ